MSADSVRRPAAGSLPTFRERTPWTNWPESQTCTPLYTVAPRTAEEVAQVVRFAIAEGIGVRTKGGGYSFSPLVHTGGILLDMVNYSGLGDIDSDNHRAWVKAGTGVNELGDLLWDKGLAVTVQGAFDLQTFVGAAATGTHGSGTGFGCLSSYVRGVRLVDGHGDIVEIDERHVAELAAAQVSLGMLGPILEVLLQAEPKYFLSKEVSFPDWSDASATLEQDAAANRHYANMWFPHHGSPALYRMSIPQDRNMADTCWIEACNRAPAPEVDTGVRSWESNVGRSYHVLSFSHPDMPKFHEMEYSVSQDKARDAIETVQSLMRASADPQFPLFIRWVRGDNTMLSPFADRDAVTLSIAGAPGTDYWEYFRRYHAALTTFGARAHWGKIHFLSREDVERLYPRHGEFRAVRETFDPKGLFLNDDTRRLFG